MLTRIEHAEQKWGGIHKLIDTWLEERKELLVQYCKLAGLPPFERSDNALPIHDDIESFCEILMDYASTGHFELYDKILEECKQDLSDEQLVEDTCSKIRSTTDQALSFNDAFSNINEHIEMSGFDRNLAQLGETLEERFELEDVLLDTFRKPSEQNA